MRVMPMIPAALLLMLSASPAAAQDWIDYTSREDRFTVNMPGQPKVETITWESEYGSVFPGRVHSVTKNGFAGPETYSVTVIDYTDAEKIYHARPHPPSFRQAEYWMMDIQGSIQYAATKLYRFKPGVKVTHDAWHYIDLVEGHHLNLTNPDGSRTFVAIYLHENRLYILDGTVPAKGPEPGLFTQSLSFLDAEGKRVRYDQIYSKKLPPETMKPPQPQGGDGGGGGRGQGGRGAGAGAGRGGQ
jgi:hypothetical protein